MDRSGILMSLVTAKMRCLSRLLVGRRRTNESPKMSNAISDRRLTPRSACGGGGNGRTFERTRDHRGVIRKEFERECLERWSWIRLYQRREEEAEACLVEGLGKVGRQ